MRAAGRGGFLGRVSIRTKAIALVVLLTVMALALVVAFAAGFATGAALAETGREDACTVAGGSWDAEASLCMGSARTDAPAAQGPAPAGSYACGDGSSFSLELAGDGARLVRAGGEARELERTGPEGTPTVYRGGPVTLTLSGPEARYEDAEQGRSVLCALR